MKFVNINYKKYDDKIFSIEYNPEMNIKDLKKKINSRYHYIYKN